MTYWQIFWVLGCGACVGFGLGVQYGLAISRDRVKAIKRGGKNG